MGTGSGGRGYTFTIRDSAPSNTNKFYIQTTYGGYNPYGQEGNDDCSLHKKGSVLPNCTGYCIGRANEIVGNKSCSYFFWGGDAWTWVQNAIKAGYTVGQTPKVGAVMCWSGGNKGQGHVAFVEKINTGLFGAQSVQTSESGWSYTNKLGDFSRTRRKTYDLSGNPNWDQGLNYTFTGFIYHPCFVDSEEGDYIAYDAGFNDYKPVSYERTDDYRDSDVTYEVTESEVDVTGTWLETATSGQDTDRVKGTGLLTYPTLVESPFIIVDMGGYTFGSYSKVPYSSKSKVQYPNYMTSIEITKVNGALNQYTLTMVYQIRAGDDPNFLDKVFGSVGYGTIKISYGDWASPTFIYKEEEALITKVTSNVEFGSSKITYTVSCTSTALSIIGKTYPFKATTDKPSNIIRTMISDNSYGLQDVFYGMKNMTTVTANSLIPSDDNVVTIPGKENMDALAYINYLVTCMSSNTSGSYGLKDCSYYLTIHDDLHDDRGLGGPYFTIQKVLSSTKTLASYDTYEVDVGYPGDSAEDSNLVTGFQINDDNSWSILYNYSEKDDNTEYVYDIDDDGKVVVTQSPGITTSYKYNYTTEAQRTWWTKVTQFPITATLTIKGLVRPAMLMTYLRINAFFYGQRHISSGLYVITKQVDKIDSSGYRTTLSLTRIGGDEDYINYGTKTVTVKTTKEVSTGGSTNTNGTTVSDDATSWTITSNADDTTDTTGLEVTTSKWETIKEREEQRIATGPYLYSLISNYRDKRDNKKIEDCMPCDVADCFVAKGTAYYKTKSQAKNKVTKHDGYVTATEAQIVKINDWHTAEIKVNNKTKYVRFLNIQVHI